MKYIPPWHPIKAPLTAPVILFGTGALSLALHCFIIFLMLDYLFPLRTTPPPRISTMVTAADGTPLRAFSDHRGIWRYPASPEQVSPLYLEALLTYEDRWFYLHPGVNPLSIFRAMLQNIRHGRIISGASTITMQVARMMMRHNETDSRPEDSGIKRKRLCQKAIQILKALQLEWHFTKDEILRRYLTYAPFGSNIEGVRTAAYTWLGKDARELSHGEAALLAVLPQAPSFYRPDRHPERAGRARNKVLDRLERRGIWPEKLVTAAKKEPVAALRFHPPAAAPLAARRLHGEQPDAPLIRTTLDFDLQVHVQEIVKNHVATLFPSSPSGVLPSHSYFSQDERLKIPSSGASSLGTPSTLPGQSGAVLVVNHKTLEIKAYVGSADFGSSAGRGHVDMIRAIRSPGSTLKPFLYGAAMDAGFIHSHSMLLDIPRYRAAYEPANFTGGFMGPVTVTSALRHSLNVPAVQVLEAYGPQRFHDRLIHAGATLRFQGKPNLSMILGGVGTNLESLVTLYTALARKGITGKPRLTKNEPVEERYLISPAAAWIVMEILRSPLPGHAGISKLTGYPPFAWKTGTSYGFRDAWALGITGEYVVGVWVGRPDGTPVPGHYGAMTALPLLKRIIEALPLSDFRLKKPDNVTRETICWPLGIALERTPEPHHPDHTGCPPPPPDIPVQPGNCLKRYEAWIINKSTPVTLGGGSPETDGLLKKFWVNAQGKRAQPSCGGVRKISIALWPESAEPWLPSKWHNQNRIPPESKGCPDLSPVHGGRIQITSIAHGNVLMLPPGEKAPASIPLKVMGGNGTVHWFLNRNPIATMENNASATLPMPPPGRYQLVATDENGRSDRVEFSVISPAP